MGRFQSLFISILIPVSLLGASGCHDLPRDPKGTTSRVQGNVIRVGLVENPPWVIRTGQDPAGVEVSLIKEFAQQLGARPEWHWGGEQQQMEALEHFQLDLLLGGLTDTTPWKKYVGLTSPYFKSRVVVGVPLAAAPIKSVKGVRVAVKNGDPAAGYLEQKGAIISPTEGPPTGDTAAAGPDWQLEQAGLKSTDIDLYPENHVIATAPGENGFIKRLDQFLYANRESIRNLLHQEGTGK